MYFSFSALSIMPSKSIHVAANGKMLFFLCLSNSSLYADHTSSFSLKYFEDKDIKLFFPPLFWPPCSNMEFLGQGSDLSHRCSNSGSLTHCTMQGIKPVSQHSRDNPDPVAPQQKLLVSFKKELCATSNKNLLKKKKEKKKKKKEKKRKEKTTIKEVPVMAQWK